nr:site-specific integrase [Bacteriovorax sp. HI3]
MELTTTTQNKDIIPKNPSHLLMEEYLQNLRRLNKSEHTIKNYRADLLKFFQWLEHDQKLKIEKVNGEIIGKYKEFLGNGGQVHQEIIRNPDGSTEKNGGFLNWFKNLIGKAVFKKRTERYLLFFQDAMSVSSRRRHLSSLKNFFEYLKESHEDSSNKFLKNPVKSKIHAITLKEVDVTPTTMITKEDFKKIEEQTFRTNERLILYLLYYGGIRLSELCSLKISNFDKTSRTITFDRKGGYVHTLVIQKDELIFKNLNFYLENTNLVGDFLFQTKEGRPYSSKAMYNKIIKIIERAIPENQTTTKITPHSFRKACATELYMKSKDLLFVRDYLNHKDAKITQTYIDKRTLSLKTRRYH